MRPSNQDQAKHLWAILALLVRRTRQSWPEVAIIFRSDGGLCRHKILDWCEQYKVKYIVSMSKSYAHEFFGSVCLKTDKNYKFPIKTN